MFNHLFSSKLQHLLRRHWFIALCVAGFAGILWIGTPAWAAPVARPLNQTVPRPTPTSVGDPVATATPRPDDDDEGDSDGDSDGEGSDNGAAPIDAPNIDFPQESDGTPSTTDPGATNPGATGPGATGPGTAAPAPSLTALVTVNGLNLRDGPGTAFNTLGSLPANTQVTVLSRNEDGTWWYICCLPDTETRGWVSAQLLTAEFDAAQAGTLIPLFGSEPDPAPVAVATPVPAGQSLPQAEQPLRVDFEIDPYFVWQGITATLTIIISNTNAVDAANVVLSDELPEVLTLVEAEADAGGTVETTSGSNGRTLLLFRWASIPADTAVTATIVTRVSPDLSDGTVIDNLVATRAANVPYSAGAVTIGMPPVLPPDFQ